MSNVRGAQTVVLEMVYGCRGVEVGCFRRAFGGGFTRSREEGDGGKTRIDRVSSEY